MDDERIIPKPATPPPTGPYGSGSTREAADAERLRAGAESAAQDIRSETERMKDEAQTRLRSAAEGGKETAADNVGSIVRALRKTAEELERDHQTTPARYVSWAADGLARFSSDLRDKDVETVLRQTQSFARRQPAVFFGSALTTGFLVARFLTSSGERRQARGVRQEPATSSATEPPVASPPR